MRLVSVRLFHLLILDPIRFIGGSVGVEVEPLTVLRLRTSSNLVGCYVNGKGFGTNGRAISSACLACI